jgi:predicted PurR-regulated permease PerM
MSATDFAAVLVAVVTFAAFVVLIVAIQALLRSLRELRSSLEAFGRATAPLLEELRATVDEAGAEVERVDHLLEAAETISATAESASRLSYLAFSSPLIRTVAFFKGVGRFLRRLVGGGRRQRRSDRRRRRRATAHEAERRAA